MHFELDADQKAILDAVDRVLDRHAGVARARELGGDAPAYDHELERALAEGGFLDVGRTAEAGPLSAALVVEAVARRAGVAAVGARALVTPALGDRIPDGPIALTRAGHTGPVRFAADARTFLVVDGDRVEVVAPRTGSVEPVASRYGYPMGRLVRPPSGGEVLEAPAGSRARSCWRVALALEIVGTLAAALDLTLEYVRQRRQFGRPIGSFQAIQHRLAELAVSVEGSRWLAREAAWAGAPTEGSAVAATQAAAAARQAFPELHQMTGAIGLTVEYDLHLWTMRLPALWLEAEWMGPPEPAVVAARWVGEAAG